MPNERSKPVKKEEVDDEDEISIGSILKKKPNTATPKSGSVKESKGKKKLAKALKKEIDDDSDDFPAKNSSAKAVKVQKRKIKEEETTKKNKKKETAEDELNNGKKRERKVFDLPGQRRETPEERDPLRIFYETLAQQVPNSEMAAIWLMESGLLPEEEAIKVLEMKQKKKQNSRVSTPMKAVITVKKKAGSIAIKRKTPATQTKKKSPGSNVASNESKRRKIKDEDSVDEDDDDDDFILSARRKKKQRTV